MLKSLLAVSALAMVFADAVAQEDAPPPVETMTCEQMTVEIGAAGALMSGQLDPEFASEAQVMFDEAQAAWRGKGAASVIRMKRAPKLNPTKPASTRSTIACKPPWLASIKSG